MENDIPMASLVPGHLPEEEHRQLWRQSIAPMLDSATISGPEAQPMLPVMNQYHLGRFLFIDCAFPAQRFRRDRALMARHDDADHLTLQIYLSGGNRAVNGDRTFSLRPGNAYSVDLAYEVEAVSEDSEVLVLVLPRQVLLDELPQLSGLRGAAFADGSACGRVFIDYLTSLRSNLPAARAGSAQALTQSLLGLMDSLILHGDVTAAVAQGAVFAAICRYIDASLGDPRLDAGRICARFNCSRATLYRLFKPHGGVREHIRRRRLMACFKAITSPKHHHRGVFDLALDFGFVSPSHFSHLFRSHFGLSPREARAGAAGAGGGVLDLPMPGGGPIAADAERMWRWAKSLTTVASMASRH